MIGETISHYKITAKLGAGGMGEVYLAEDTDLKRKVALKFLLEADSAEPEVAIRFRHEAQAAAALSHPNVVTVFEVSEHEGRPYIVMEYVEGPTLSQHCETGETSIDEILNLVVQIGEGLKKAHETGIVHRDLKPANILVDQDRRPKILDFGLAKLRGVTKVTKTGSTQGTAAYMSPEQVAGQEVDHRTDVWSLGVILYEMVAGRLPFDAEHEAAVAYTIANSEPEPLARYKAGVSDEVQRIVSKCLAKDRGERYQSAADLVTDLRLARQAALPSRSAPAIGTPGRRTRTGILISVAVVAILFLLSVLTPVGRQLVRGLFVSEATGKAKHLAVLRFATVGESTTGEMFSEGLLETLTSKLTQLEGAQGSLRVMPASEVRSGAVTSVREARSAFGVTHVVTGSVQYVGDQVRVTLNLVDAEAERQLQSLVIDDYRADFTSLQDSIVLELAAMLDVELDSQHRNLLVAGGTTEIEAYGMYLQAYGYIQRFERIGELDTAITLLGQAVDIDPRYARAWAGLGEVYWQKYRMSDDRPWIDRAIESCRHAIELDDRLGSPHISMGVIYTGTGRSEEAIPEFKLALQLDPLSHRAFRGLAGAYETLNELELAEITYKKVVELKPDYWLGYRDLLLFYLSHGHHDQALQYLDKVVALNPEGFTYWNDLGGLYYFLDRHDNAKQMWVRSLEIAPNYAAHSNLGTLLYMARAYDSAAAMYENALMIDDHDYQVWINLASAYHWIPGHGDTATSLFRRALQMAEEQRSINPLDATVLSHLAECYGMLHERDAALEALGQALSLAPEDVDIMLRAGVLHEQLGARDTALAWIEKAIEHGFPIAQLERLPELVELCSDPRFVQIRDRVSAGQGTRAGSEDQDQ